jgi:hypothetical protein
MNDSLTRQVRDITVWHTDDEYSYLEDVLDKKDIYRIVQYIKKRLKENNV